MESIALAADSTNFLSASLSKYSFIAPVIPFVEIENLTFSASFLNSNPPPKQPFKNTPNSNNPEKFFPVNFNHPGDSI